MIWLCLLTTDSDDEVIYEHDEEEELGRMLERYKEEGVFSHSDGDEDASEDGAEEATGRRQVKFVLFSV